LDDTLSDSNVDIEEEIECQVQASETCSSPSAFDAEIEEEPLSQIRIDRTAPLLQSHKKLESLDKYLTNSNGAADELDVNEPVIGLEASQVAFAAPPGVQTELVAAAPAIVQTNIQLNNNFEIPNSSIEFTENANAAEVETSSLGEEPMIEPVAAFSAQSALDRTATGIPAETPSDVVDYVSQVVDRAMAVAMNFDKEEFERNADLAAEDECQRITVVRKQVDANFPKSDSDVGNFVEEEPLIEVTKARPAESIPSGAFWGIDQQPDANEVPLNACKVDQPKVLVTRTSEEEETKGQTKLNGPHISPSPRHLKDDQPPVVEEIVVQVKILPKKLDDKIINNDLFTFGEPGQLVEEELIQPVTEKKAEAALKIGHIEVTEELIIPQPQVSTPQSLGSSTDKSKRKDAAPEPQSKPVLAAASVNATLNAKPPSAKPKSKGFFSFFKRTPKTKKREVNPSEQREKSNSLPKSATPADMEKERSSTLHKPDDGKKSGFFTFGSRGRRVSDKNPPASFESKAVGGSLNALSDKKGDSGKSTPTTKTNIRIFQIMAETGKEPEPAGQEEVIAADNARLTASQPAPVSNELGLDQVVGASPTAVVTSGPSKQQQPVRSQVSRENIPDADRTSKKSVQTQGPTAGQQAATSKYLIVVAIDFGMSLFYEQPRFDVLVVFFFQV